MDLQAHLTQEKTAILDEAATALLRNGMPHYSAGGESRKRLERLFELALGAIRECDLVEILRYSEDLGEQRFAAGFSLNEVQTAFNVLEEAIWENCVRKLPPQDLAEALGLTSTVLGAAKDSLARAYVSRAAGTHVPAVNMAALFSGT